MNGEVKKILLSQAREFLDEAKEEKGKDLAAISHFLKLIFFMLFLLAEAYLYSH